MKNRYFRNIFRIIVQFSVFAYVILGYSLSAQPALADGETTVTVTEQIPGMDCGTGSTSGEGPEHKTYDCKIQPGFGSVILILRGLIKYATFITALIGVLMLVVSGVQYSMAGASGDAKKHATDRIQKVLAGITLLFLIGFFLNSVAPWIYR